MSPRELYVSLLGRMHLPVAVKLALFNILDYDEFTSRYIKEYLKSGNYNVILAMERTLGSFDGCQEVFVYTKRPLVEVMREIHECRLRHDQRMAGKPEVEKHYPLAWDPDVEAMENPVVAPADGVSDQILAKVASRSPLVDSYALQDEDDLVEEPAAAYSRKKGSYGKNADVPLSEAKMDEIHSSISAWMDSRSTLESGVSLMMLSENTGHTKGEITGYFAGKNTDFKTWRVSYLIERSKAMLLADEKKLIVDIAGELGFKDKSNFHRQFHKLVGCTPGEWRSTNGHPEILLHDMSQK